MMLKQSLKSLLVTAIVILVMPFIRSIGARQSSLWELVLVSNDLRTLHVVTQDSVKAQPLPTNLPSSKKYQARRLSPRGQYLLLESMDPPAAMPAMLVNLQKQTCCAKVALLEGDDPKNVLEFRLGGFSPDGSQFVGVYVIQVGTGRSAAAKALLVTVDAATGKLFAQFEVPPDHPAKIPFIAAWEGNQIFLRPACFRCGGFKWDRYYVWEPQAGITGEVPMPFGTLGDRRGLFGEFVNPEYDANYPAWEINDPNAEIPFHPNTIRYYTDNKDTTPDVWYHDPANRRIIYVRWVMGGQGYLFKASAKANDFNGRFFLGLRDGKIIQAHIVRDETYLLSETPDGWIMGGKGFIDFYFVRDGEVRRKNLAENAGTLSAVLYTSQGTPVTGIIAAGPPPATPEIAQSNPAANATSSAAATCAGFNLRSRLTIGGQARVLPGDANLINSLPSRPAKDPNSKTVGKIPAGGVFTVIDGPACSHEILWWKVDYKGISGWTGEGTGDTYWVEPLS
jgi:hypothetical protein